MSFVNVTAPVRKVNGQSYGGFASAYFVEIKKGKSISVYREDERTGKTAVKTFKVGDYAEYDSYNLSYYGKILSITDKTVTIDKNAKYPHINEVSKTRMKIYNFAWRNYDFDLEETAAKNADTMMYI
jgi:hypothetical protein